MKADIRDILKQLYSYMGYLKGKSARMVFERLANLKYKFGNRHFWSEGYYVSIVELNEATIKKYIQDQGKYDTHFTGSYDLQNKFAKVPK